DPVVVPVVPAPEVVPPVVEVEPPLVPKDLGPPVVPTTTGAPVVLSGLGSPPWPSPEVVPFCAAGSPPWEMAVPSLPSLRANRAAQPDSSRAVAQRTARGARRTMGPSTLGVTWVTVSKPARNGQGGSALRVHEAQRVVTEDAALHAGLDVLELDEVVERCG